MRVLFIGNSHTFVHYVPLRVAAYFEEQGEPLEAVMLTHPGVGLDWHLEQSQTYFNLLYGGYDAVVLQHSAHPFPGRESLLSAGEKLISLVPEGTQVFLYMTWSEKISPEGQEVMSEAYEALAERTGAVVCPVGRIWQQVTLDHPDEDLYFADGEHSSVLGASLAAAVISRTLLGLPVPAKSCYDDAKRLELVPQDPRMIDLVVKDGELELQAEI